MNQESSDVVGSEFGQWQPYTSGHSGEIRAMVSLREERSRYKGGGRFVKGDSGGDMSQTTEKALHRSNRGK